MTSGPAATDAQATHPRPHHRRRRGRGGDRRRRNAVLLGGLAIALTLVAIVASVAARRQGDADDVAWQVIPAGPVGSPTTQREAAPVPDISGIAGALAWDTGDYPGAAPSAAQLQNEHVDGPVIYTIVPPVGGPHSGTWLNAGVYTLPVPSERAVHTMEHGAVWLTYRPDLDDDQVTALRELVARQSQIRQTPTPDSAPVTANRYVVMSPWADATLPSPIVLSSWGHQLRADSAHDDRLQQFIDTFRNSSSFTPEHGAVVDGAPLETGGRAAYSGSSTASPSGAAR